MWNYAVKANLNETYHKITCFWVLKGLVIQFEILQNATWILIVRLLNAYLGCFYL